MAPFEVLTDRLCSGTLRIQSQWTDGEPQARRLSRAGRLLIGLILPRACLKEVVGIVLLFLKGTQTSYGVLREHPQHFCFAFRHSVVQIRSDMKGAQRRNERPGLRGAPAGGLGTAEQGGCENGRCRTFQLAENATTGSGVVGEGFVEPRIEGRFAGGPLRYYVPGPRGTVDLAGAASSCSSFNFLRIPCATIVLHKGLVCPRRAVASCAASPLVFMRFRGRLALRAVTL